MKLTGQRLLTGAIKGGIYGIIASTIVLAAPFLTDPVNKESVGLDGRYIAYAMTFFVIFGVLPGIAIGVPVGLIAYAILPEKKGRNRGSAEA